MKPALSSCFSLLTCVLACWALNGTEESLCTKEALCARGLVIPIDDQLRQVAVWTGNGSRVEVHGPFVDQPTSSEEKWLNFTAIQNGSGYCVSSEALAKDSCDEDSNSLHLWSSRDTKWNLEPAIMTSGRCAVLVVRIRKKIHAKI
ncbi:uncharacterized protein LOC134774234 [Penaeus indicus]|uniref:uncharacterized protein LOC134774234 n=1 Tax=Penaeus indicus TaxID=29960 RepID=UPI00300CFCE2